MLVACLWSISFFRGPLRVSPWRSIVQVLGTVFVDARHLEAPETPTIHIEGRPAPWGAYPFPCGSQSRRLRAGRDPRFEIRRHPHRRHLVEGNWRATCWEMSWCYSSSRSFPGTSSIGGTSPPPIGYQVDDGEQSRAEVGQRLFEVLNALDLNLIQPPSFSWRSICRRAFCSGVIMLLPSLPGAVLKVPVSYCWWGSAATRKFLSGATVR